MILRDKFDAAENGRKCGRPDLEEGLGNCEGGMVFKRAAATGRNMSPKRSGPL